jgi:hypothetical protein
MPSARNARCRAVEKNVAAHSKPSTDFQSFILFAGASADDFVAVKAPRINKVQQASTSSPQQVPQQSLGSNKILQISKSA